MRRFVAFLIHSSVGRWLSSRLAIGALAALPWSSLAMADTSDPLEKDAAAVEASAAEPSYLVMARRVDELLAQGQAAAGVKPAPLADDAEFLRRASLDLTGVVPRVAEVREFLANEDPNKRQLLIER